DKRAYAEVDKKIGQITRDMAVAPITARGQVIGVIEVINSLSGTGFTQAKLEFLINIASHTGLLIENARNVQDLVRSNRLLDRKISELNGLHEIGRAISATLDYEELKRSLLRTLMKIMRVGTGGIIEVRAGSRTAQQTYGLTINDSGINETSQMVTYQEITDIALWMKENREPFYFGADPSSETAGLANRFRRDNADAFKETGGPDLWLPVFEIDTGAVAFVLALGDLTLRRRNPVDDLAFFRGVMTLAQSGYRNVQLYTNALHSRDKEETIRKSFQKYVPARVVHEVIEQTEQPKPRQQKVSILFADIRNFTRLAESMDPPLLLELLNEFFEEMVDAVGHRNGIVDKFMGDALMALFGVPNAEEDDASNALLAAQDMIARLQALNRRRLSSRRALFEMGMGLHTGSAIIGNIGASQRLDYTAVGDAVNLAARLEKLTKYYHSALLFSEETLRESRQTIPNREVDLIQVRGRVAQTRVFELLTPEMEPMAAEWSDALASYRNAHFREALTVFDRLAGAGDQVSAIYAERARQFIANPPAGDWQAVFKLEL
ncbi:MAG: hypothetical protein HY042_03695, partial [Spirochaetia bacterium]|nr:hypothetical protein [Spirochaetia bacterium]